ncbi:hypothetical protein AB8P51_14985 [Muriicola sp. SD30]|uniref:hypothetical protein n=1 Tax=Muriicola sp. SD30 TaxID=3240936 RepID=UPI00350F9BFF
MKASFIVLILLLFVSTQCIACICKVPLELKALQEHEYKFSDGIFIAKVTEIDSSTSSFQFIVLESLKGENYSRKLKGTFKGDCTPSIRHKGKWILYGQFDNDNIFRINACGLTRSFKHPYSNIRATKGPPPPPPREPINDSAIKTHKKLTKKWFKENVPKSKRDLAIEIKKLKTKN